MDNRMPYDNTIQAKKTYYRGTWYDSNTEAKIAEAFDDLGIVYEYHRQCFRDKRFPYGQYTPDFHLPNTDQYVEVAWALDQRHRGNLTTFCEMMGYTDADGTKALFIDSSGNVRRCWLFEGVLLSRKSNVENIFEAAEHPGSVMRDGTV